MSHEVKLLETYIFSILFIPVFMRHAIVWRMHEHFFSSLFQLNHKSAFKNENSWPVPVAVATGVVMLGGGFSFMSSIRLPPFRSELFRLPVRRRSFNWICLGGKKQCRSQKFIMGWKQVFSWFCPLLEKIRFSIKDTWSDLVEGTTVDAEEAILAEDVEELRKAELGTWTTLVTVIVCLMLFVADCFVTVAPSDGKWFSWFKTNVVVDGWGLFCWWQREMRL